MKTKNACYLLRMAGLICILLGAALLGAQTVPVSTPYNIRDFGAKGDGTTKDTQTIQKAIDLCTANGGGTVFFPPGNYLSGSLHLKSNVALYLDHGARITASKEEADFDPYEKLDFKNDADHETSFFHHALIWGENVERIAITGTGIIDGNRSKRGGPKPIALKRCKHVTIKDVTILNAPNYAISMLGTDYVNIDGVSILNGYCDGIDPDCCHHVRISNCHIETWDDAIVLKTSFSLGEHRSTENLTVTNCVLATNCNAFKLGTESGGDFKYITVSNCVFFDRPGMSAPMAGIALESVDGSNIAGVAISNISMKNVRAPIFLRLGNRGRDMENPTPGTLKDVVISNIVATGAEHTCALSGLPNHPIEAVQLENIRITYMGGGTLEQTAIKVPEMVAKYPDARMFGDLPAYGFYIRHVSGLKLHSVSLALQSPDLRHALVCDDVVSLDVESFAAPAVEGTESTLKLTQVIGALIRGCSPPTGTEIFLKVFGASSSDIALLGNDFGRVKKAVVLGDEVGEKAVAVQADR